MAEVFISYAGADEAHARRLAQALETEGWSVWWDRHIRPGLAWSDVIESELAKARCVLVLWSAASVKHHWVQNEAREALRRHILIPVVADRTVRPPLEFAHLQSAYLPNWDIAHAESEYAELVASVRDVLRHGTAVPRRPAAPAPRPQPRRRRVNLRLLLAIVILLLLLIASTIVAWSSLRHLDELTNAAATRPAKTPATTETAVADDPLPGDIGVGMQVSGTRCIVFLVARDLLLTHSSCVNSLTETVRVTLGASSPEYTTKVIERRRYHALLQLAPDAGTRYRPISLETREARLGEPVRVLHHRRDVPSTEWECRVGAAASEKFELDCVAGVAAPGAPVLSATDGVLLGMHRTMPRSVVSMEVILRESAVLP